MTYHQHLSFRGLNFDVSVSVKPRLRLNNVHATTKLSYRYWVIIAVFGRTTLFQGSAKHKVTIVLYWCCAYMYPGDTNLWTTTKVCKWHDYGQYIVSTIYIK